ncbi:hypothetical protein [Paraliomyxa miuraensis]|uniref:hypothetical protein n=1 Tax=Paraliomyxa miuraensis TaxID=376150 RepID=UPI002255F1D8|nr:hypothetical protein [Paraliomyxa miuraensis]MCX4239352.1 hypothetical protein [Paraliomyxa miuraensis]
MRRRPLAEDILWAPVSDGVDACAETHVAYVDCLETLSCSEIQQHFALINMAPTDDGSAHLSSDDGPSARYEPSPIAQ